MPRPAAQNSVAERVRFDAQYVIAERDRDDEREDPERELVEVGGERGHRFVSGRAPAPTRAASAAPGGGRSKRPS